MDKLIVFALEVEHNGTTLLDNYMIRIRMMNKGIS